ncbi:hypothetical protein [Candidatus Amarobacter glycogenicus]|uniref:hypothetical protein n=1 Tax=Candidatus Amarobacter glycogenicus TaxID=3140699 RepID=UPI002A0B3827|nr:hypothetical protein [Dehalococcoidia bacterium]
MPPPPSGIARDQRPAHGASQSVVNAATSSTKPSALRRCRAFARDAASMDPPRLNEWINTMMGIYTPIYTVMVVADANGKIVAANTVDLNGKPARKGSETTEVPEATGVPWRDPRTRWRPCSGASGETKALSFTCPHQERRRQGIGVWTNRSTGVTPTRTPCRTRSLERHGIGPLVA